MDGDDLQQEGRVPRKRGTHVIVLGIAFAIVLAIGFGGGVIVGGSSNSGSGTHFSLLGGIGATPDSSANLNDFWKVWNILQAQYVITHASSTLPTTQEKVWGAIQGLTNSYGDPYTVFMPPEEAKQFSENISGSFTGVGVELGVNQDGILTVIAPLKGTPADKAGMKPGDLIIGINGKSTQGVSSDDAVTLIRGKKGTPVTFTIVRGKQQLEIKVVRDIIQVPEIDYGLDKKTGVYKIALYEFTENSADLFKTAFTAFKASGSKLLVIDLRGNPGGYLTAAADIASHFLPAGATIVTEDYQGKQSNDTLTSTGTYDVPAGTKVVVLIDQGSASASEILAGALHDHKAATLIGERSFGKGSVQQLIDVDGGSLKVTIARWLTPSGHSIMGNGITPDIAATTTAADQQAGKDPQFDRAVQFLTTGK